MRRTYEDKEQAEVSMNRDWVKTPRCMLMVCRHTPRHDGNPRQRLNGRLLTITQRTHRVLLASLLDDGICLPQWRELARRTEKLVIVPRGWFNNTRRLGRHVREWAATHHFHTVLCDEPVLWPLVEPLRAAQRLCLHETAQVLLARALPPDVIRLPVDAADDRLIDLLQPRLAADAAPGPQVVVTQTVPLRRAA